MTAPQTAAGLGEGEASGPAAQTCTAKRHGNMSAYKGDGCRCLPARRANTRYSKVYRMQGQRRIVDATGTHRRLHALAAIGWGYAEVAERLGVSIQAVGFYARRPRIKATSAARVADLYDRLADHRGPSEHAIKLARTRGWLGPLWWDDDTIDDPSWLPPTKETQAQRNREDRDERRAEVARLTARGLSIAEIAQRLGVDDRQVNRDRVIMRAAVAHRVAS